MRYAAAAYIAVVVFMVGTVGAAVSTLLDRNELPAGEATGVWIAFSLFAVTAVALCATAWKETR